jgi:predicted RNA-binding Zn-ribbon protein involved in translation (DUF1610 family)
MEKANMQCTACGYRVSEHIILIDCQKLSFPLVCPECGERTLIRIHCDRLKKQENTDIFEKERFLRPQISTPDAKL